MKYYCTNTELLRKKMFDYLRELPHTSNQTLLKSKFNRDLIGVLKKVEIPPSKFTNNNNNNFLW